eukprot:15462420-Alexandrium_andersonii.AAC.2
MVTLMLLMLPVLLMLVRLLLMLLLVFRAAVVVVVAVVVVGGCVVTTGGGLWFTASKQGCVHACNDAFNCVAEFPFALPPAPAPAPATPVAGTQTYPRAFGEAVCKAHSEHTNSRVFDDSVLD